MSALVVFSRFLRLLGSGCIKMVVRETDLSTVAFLQTLFGLSFVFICLSSQCNADINKDHFVRKLVSNVFLKQ